jgi:hypothetical protein
MILTILTILTIMSSGFNYKFCIFIGTFVHFLVHFLYIYWYICTFIGTLLVQHSGDGRKTGRNMSEYINVA